jgi:hypothetical protein
VTPIVSAAGKGCAALRQSASAFGDVLTEEAVSSGVTTQFPALAAALVAVVLGLAAAEQERCQPPRINSQSVGVFSVICGVTARLWVVLAC